MKLFFLTLIIAIFHSNQMHAFPIKGVVRDKSSNTPLPHEVIFIYRQNKLWKRIETDQFGEFQVELSKGLYAIRIKLPNGKWIKATKQIQKKIYWIISFQSNQFSEKNQRYDIGKTRAIKGYSRSYETSAYESAPAAISLSTPLKAGLAYDEGTSISRADKGMLPKSGLLTAGEINDFQKWNLWESLNQKDWLPFQKEWKLSPSKRYTVQLKNESNQPVSDIKVNLIGYNGKVLWTARTDNTGKAELWEHYFEDSIPMRACRIDVYHATKVISIKQMIDQQQGINTLTLKEQCSTKNAVDIAFVVDATGSMGDEIQYLQEEMKDVIDQVSKENKRLDIQTGAVFYRDLGDEYLTKMHAFNKDVNATRAFIKEQAAGGGGDFPEAVDAALAVSIRELTWRENTVAKILFLVLDAPPHGDQAIVNRTHQLMQEAAERGIRIIPIASSGIDKSTEFFLRSLALATNGTYTFLTDHSGIGNKHLAPTTDSFKVELLNELMIRLIKQFTYLPACRESNKTDTITLNQENPFNLYDVTDIIKVYPNPAIDYCMVQIPDKTEEMYLTDLNGKILQLLSAKGQSELRVVLENYPTGIYFIRCKKQDKWLVEKLLITK